MATTRPPPAGAAPQRRPHEASVWAAWVLFAGVIMVLDGMFSIVAGLVGLLNPGFFLVTRDQMMINVGFTTWGWLHLVVGVVVTAAGLSLGTGRAWARGVGVVAALVQAVSHIAFLAAYPTWSLLIIALDVIVIFALVVHGEALREVRNA
jgi:hypothetical protein